MDDLMDYIDKCRVDKKYTDVNNPSYPFCSPACHIMWADQNIPAKENGKPKLTVKQMQESLKKMGEEK